MSYVFPRQVESGGVRSVVHLELNVLRGEVVIRLNDELICVKLQYSE